MKKRLILGDVHGHIEQVKYAYEKEQPDQVIILGDYVDSFVVKPEEQKKCLDELLKMHRYHCMEHGKDSFIMLMGNHDFHYIYNIERYSGYNPDTNKLVHETLAQMVDDNMLPIIYIDRVNKTIYSHAGVSMSWLKERCHGCRIENVNNLSIDYLKFTYKDGGNAFGSSKYNSPIWIRPGSLMDDMYAEDEVFTQIVGHTHTHFIESYAVYDQDMKLYMCDCLVNQYLVETLDDDGILIERKIVDTNKEFYGLQ